jgi:hypothetical protein
MAGYAVVGALLRCPLPLDLLRSLLVVFLTVVPIRRFPFLLTDRLHGMVLRVWVHPISFRSLPQKVRG